MTSYAAAATKLLGRRLDDMAERIRQARHTPAGDFEALSMVGYDLTAVREHLDRAEGAWAALMVDAGASWKQIGDALAMSKQGAQQKFAGMLADRPLSGL